MVHILRVYTRVLEGSVWGVYRMVLAGDPGGCIGRVLGRVVMGESVQRLGGSMWQSLRDCIGRVHRGV